MVWVYDDVHLTSDEKKVEHFVFKRIKNKTVSEQTVKLLSLYSYLKQHTFRSPKQIEASAFYDKKHTRPIFDEKTAAQLFKALKQKGGRSITHPASDQLVRDIITGTQSYLPNFLTGPANAIYKMITGPVVLAEDKIPLLRTALTLGKASAKLGDSVAETVATDVAGPLGTAVVAIPVAIVGMSAAIVSVAEDDLGGAVSQLAQATPFIGPILVSALNAYEDINRPAPVKKGGKRFSTKRNSIPKCPRTRRNKCARS